MLFAKKPTEEQAAKIAVMLGYARDRPDTWPREIIDGLYGRAARAAEEALQEDIRRLMQFRSEVNQLRKRKSA